VVRLICVVTVTWAFGCGVGFQQDTDTTSGSAGQTTTTSGNGGSAGNGGSSSGSGGSGAAGGDGGAVGGGGGSGGAGGAGGNGGACPSGVVDPTSSHCYVHVAQATQWNNIEAQCTALGTGFHPAAITSNQELQFVRSLISNPIGEPTHIGGNDKQTEGVFVWTTGETWWASWLSGEPNNAGGAQDCVAMQENNGAFGFDDKGCSVSHHYLCERP